MAFKELIILSQAGLNNFKILIISKVNVDILTGSNALQRQYSDS